MDKLFIDETKIALVIEKWVGENKSLLIEGCYLNKSTPLPFNEIMIVVGYTVETVELIVSGESFDNFTITMLNSSGKKMFTCTIFDFVTAYDESLGFDFGYQMGINVIDQSIKSVFNDNGIADESLRNTTMMICEIMIYIMFHKEEVTLEKTVKSHDKHKPKKSQKNKKRKVYLERHYKLIGAKHTNSSENKRKYMAESWAVRGHMRKCKNGKITFVKPYVKGKGRKVDKDYKL